VRDVDAARQPETTRPWSALRSIRSGVAADVAMRRGHEGPLVGIHRRSSRSWKRAAPVTYPGRHRPNVNCAPSWPARVS